MSVAWLSFRSRTFIFSAIGAVACTAEPRDDGFTATTVMTTGPDDTSGVMTMTTTTTAESSTTDTPADTSGDTSCAGEIVDAPDAPEGWEGPVIAYGFEGNVGEPPDCGGGVPATALALVSPDATTCACGCDAMPEQLCASSMFGDCAGAVPLGSYSGGCHAFDEPVLQFQANAIPLGSCVATPAPTSPPLTPSLWGCEIPEDGCSQAQDINRVCIYAQGTASECPAGFENGPIAAHRVTCDGACDNCMTPEYCMTQLELELHDTADCSGIAAQTVAPQECPGGSFAAVRAKPTPISCPPPAELTRTPVIMSVCCLP